MSLRDGTPKQQALFAFLVSIALFGLLLAVADKFERIGTPNVGWILDTEYLSPTREDVSVAGLRGGGRVLRINDQEVVAGSQHGHAVGPNVNTAVGASNTIVVRRPDGEQREQTIEVRPWRAEDFIFTQGATDIIGLFFLLVGVTVFVLRPYETQSWALLALCCFVAGTLLVLFLPTDLSHFWNSYYFVTVVAFTPYVPMHALLAFPVIHPILVRRRRQVLGAIYGMAVLQGVANITGWTVQYEGPFVYARAVDSAVLLATMTLFIVRAAWLAAHGADRLAAQRARILLGGTVFGVIPFALIQFARESFGLVGVDPRFLIWPLGIFALALARITIRPALTNARIAVRKAILYTAAVAVLSAIAFVLVSMRPYLVAVLLFPLLYVWPRFEERLNRRLYPQRARFPELLRAVGARLDAATTVDQVLDVIAAAPTQVCDARSAVAFFLPGIVDAREHLRSTDGLPASTESLENEPLVHLLRATRREILRSQLAVEPQYGNVRAECEAGFERLGAVLLLPMVHEQRLVGGLAVAARAFDDPYEAAEIDALTTAAQQGVQAVMRVAAIERLFAREREFGDLKRYFSPQIINRVMAMGGASELGSQRKFVTVLFADLRGFTSFSESVEPEEVISTLDEYHSAMGARIAEYEGTLERFAGDGFMVFFNDPVDQPDHVERAARMALSMRSDVERLCIDWTRKGYNIHAGFGIHSGYATCGFIGYEGRRDYAVIGSVTNLAARLSDIAGPGEILISGRSYGAMEDRLLVEPAGELQLKGFQQPQAGFRLLGLAALSYQS